MFLDSLFYGECNSNKYSRLLWDCNSKLVLGKPTQHFWEGLLEIVFGEVLLPRMISFADLALVGL